jgi:arylsulfatase A-like enzyme
VELGPSAVERRSLIRQSSLSPAGALVLAAWFGLVGGLLDLGVIFAKRDLAHATLYYEQGKNFRWVVPLASLAVMMIPGLMVAVVALIRPGKISPRLATWLFAPLAIWGALLRLPLYGFATLLLAAGAAGVVSRGFAERRAGLRRLAQFSLPVFLCLIVTMAVVSYRRQAREKAQAVARLPAPPDGAGNLLLIVMDTVRAGSMGLYGYDRDTTPHLTRWAKRGVRFDWALAPAPWTFPSHCSFMTGQWPSTLGAHWVPTLEPAFTTLAAQLASCGYSTAGFAANTYWCSYESGMDRGFTHYEDYPLTPRAMLGSTMAGRWLLENMAVARDFYRVKWIRSQSRDAREINQAFLDWLARERPGGRPFFAFLNYLDAHEPFIPPLAQQTSFGRRPQSRTDYQMLLEYWDRDKITLSDRDVELARDSYDNCIAALDRQIGALCDELDRRGLLENTVVMITGDHGEQFGEHGVFNHGFSLYAQETRVPLVVISSRAPAGLLISEPVSLRDLPATFVDLARLGSSAILPGRSLAECWRAGAVKNAPSPSRAISEVDIPLVIGPERGRGSNQRGFAMSVVAEGFHYVLDARGTEELYDVANDPQESRNLKSEPGLQSTLNRFRVALAEHLRDNRVPTGIAADYQNQLRKLIDMWLPRPSI